ncbi:MAG TPA: hypothetical protein VGD81_09825 [Opitutaceae bacterium]
MTERDQLIALCARFGAGPAQAATMADQLLKRCAQLAVERGIPRTEAMAHLLQILVRSRRGEPVPGFEGVAKPAPPPP